MSPLTFSSPPRILRGDTSDKNLALCGDTEQMFDEPLLADRIAFRQPADLTFANYVYCLISRDRAQRAVN